MTAPEPSGRAITGDVAARTAAALLAADPPEIADARRALTMARVCGRQILWLWTDTLAELLASVDYLRGELAGTREALAIAEDRATPGGEG